MALVLDNSGLAAWKCGRRWRVWSSRCLSACLKFGIKVSCMLCPAIHQIELLVPRTKKISFSSLILFGTPCREESDLAMYYPW